MAGRSMEQIDEKIHKLEKDKTEWQGSIESYQWWIGEYQSQLQDPSIPEWRRAQLKEWVQDIRSDIQQHNVSISSIEGELVELMGKRAAILNQGSVPSPSPATAASSGLVPYPSPATAASSVSVPPPSPSATPSGSVPSPSPATAASSGSVPPPSPSVTSATPSGLVPYPSPATAASSVSVPPPSPSATPSGPIPTPSPAAASATPPTLPDLLQKHEDLPGVILSQPLKEARVTSRGKEIYLEEEIGASLSIPKNSIAGEVKVGLAASFSGSHEIPEDMEPVGPAYVVTTDKPVELDKNMTLRMKHTVENTTGVILVEAGITGSPGQCILRRSAKAIEHKHRFGIVKVKELTSTIYRLVKPKRRKGDKDEEKRFYSARLYKSVLGNKVTAVFCLCSDHPIFATFCDKAIAEYYPDLFNKAEEAKGTVINALIITSDSVAVMKAEDTAWTVAMDRSMISRLEVDSPERYNVELSELRDYPPRIVLDLTPPGPTSPPADLIVQGLKGSCSFTIPTPVKIPSPVEPHRSRTMSVNIAKFHDATVGFEAKVFTEAESPLVSCARSMAGIMAEVKPLLNDPENVNDLVKKVQEIEGLIKSVVSLTVAKNVQGSVTRVSMISHQLKKVAPAMRKSSGGDPEKWQGAVDVLVANSVNLMHSIGELIKEAQVAAVKSRTRDGISLKLLDLIKWRDESGKKQKFRLISRVSSKWESFGYRLDLHQNMLDAWREECLNNSARCWCKVMHHWLTGGDTPDYPATWDGLYEMLEDVEYFEVARQLREAVLAAKVQR